MIDQEERDRFVNAAKSWLGTPYHHRAQVKGAGVDCATLIAACAYEAGLCPKLELPFYTFQWNVNQSDEAYLNVVRQYMHEVPTHTGPGDIVVWKFGKTFSHGAIIVQWPIIIHALVNDKVTYEDAEKCGFLNWIGQGTDKGKPRPKMFFSKWK